MKLGLVDSITTAAMQARKNMLCRAQLNLDLVYGVPTCSAI